MYIFELEELVFDSRYRYIHTNTHTRARAEATPHCFILPRPIKICKPSPSKTARVEALWHQCESFEQIVNWTVWKNRKRGRDREYSTTHRSGYRDMRRRRQLWRIEKFGLAELKATVGSSRIAKILYCIQNHSIIPFESGEYNRLIQRSAHTYTILCDKDYVDYHYVRSLIYDRSSYNNQGKSESFILLFSKKDASGNQLFFIKIPISFPLFTFAMKIRSLGRNRCSSWNCNICIDIHSNGYFLFIRKKK